MRNEGMNFCVNMVECTVGMGVSMLPLYEGRVPCSTEIKKKSLHYDLLRTLGFDVLRKETLAVF